MYVRMHGLLTLRSPIVFERLLPPFGVCRGFCGSVRAAVGVTRQISVTATVHFSIVAQFGCLPPLGDVFIDCKLPVNAI